jgi:hypothetical protein
VNVLQPKHVNLDEHPAENNIANLTKAFKDSEELFDFAQVHHRPHGSQQS